MINRKEVLELCSIITTIPQPSSPPPLLYKKGYLGFKVYQYLQNYIEENVCRISREKKFKKKNVFLHCKIRVTLLLLAHMLLINL